MGVDGMDVAPQTRGLVQQEQQASTVQPATWEKSIIICSRLLGIAVQILQAHLLGAQVFGIYLFVQWLALLSVPALSTGISTLASRRIAFLQSREAPRLIAGIFYFLWYRQHRQIARYCLWYFLLAYLLAQIMHAYAANLLLLAGLAMLPLQLSNVVGTTLRGLRRTDLLALLDFFGVLLALLFTILLSQAVKTPPEMFLLAGALASTLTLILSVASIMRILPLAQARRPGIFLRERLLDSLKPSWLLFLCDAIVWQNAELLLLACWPGSREMGYYAFCVLISNGFLGLAPALFTNLTLPLWLRHRAIPRSNNAYDAFIRTSRDIAFLAIPCSLALILFAPTLVVNFLGNSFLPIIQPLQILLVSATLGSIATIGMTHLAQGESKQVLLRLNGTAAALKIVLSVPLVVCWGITGAAIACALVQGGASLAAFSLCFLRLRRMRQTGTLEKRKGAAS
jgi:O-antigen/teichoic acid export membrane protein